MDGTISGERGVRPASLFLVLVAAAPFEVLYVPLLPLNIPVSFVVAVMLLFILLLRQAPLVSVGNEKWVLLFIMVATVSLVAAAAFTDDIVFEVMPETYGIRGSRYRGFYQLFYFMITYLAAVAAVNSCIHYPELKKAVSALLWMTIGINFFAYYEVAAKYFDLPLIYFSFSDWDYRSEANMLGIPRAYGVFGEPGSYGRHLIAIIMLVLTLYSRRASLPSLKTLPLRTALVTSGVALTLTFSISSLGVLAGTGLLFAVVNVFKKGQKKNAAFLAVTVSTLGIAALAWSGILGVVMEEKVGKMVSLFTGAPEDIENYERAYGLELGMAAFLERPVLGVGYGNEMFYTYMPHISELTFGSFNLAMTMLVEVGIIGTLIFLGLLWTVLKAGKRNAKSISRRSESNTMLLGLKWAFSAALLHHALYGAPRLTIMDWIFIGLISSASRIETLLPDREESRTPIALNAPYIRMVR